MDGRPVRFGLCVPCYNAERFLPELAASIRAQTRPFDEVILYDDASTDRSLEVARSLGAFTRVVSSSVNGGPALARNGCLEAASADWIHFQDADDLLEPRYLERCIPLTREADVVVVSGPTCEGEDFDYSGLNGVDPLRYCLTRAVLGSFGLYRRELLARLGGCSTDLARLGNSDNDLHVRLAAAGARFTATSEQLIIHKQHPDSFSMRRWEVVQRGAVVSARRWLRDLPPDYHHLVVRYLERIGRESDRAGFIDVADEAWRAARASGQEVQLPSPHAVLRSLGRLLGPEVVSALRRGRLVTAARRLRSLTRTQGP